jgi:hypothetical protein
VIENPRQRYTEVKADGIDVAPYLHSSHSPNQLARCLLTRARSKIIIAQARGDFYISKILRDINTHLIIVKKIQQLTWS